MAKKKIGKRLQTRRTDRVYFDYASATPTRPEVLRVVHANEKYFANPGSIHAEGVYAMRLLEMAREQIAHELGCKSRQVMFTSGLSESNNVAILGYARRLEVSGKSLKNTHWITSSIEHDSVLECFGEVERLGGSVSFVDPGANGIVSPESVARVLRPDTVFVSIGWANNEIGTVQPLSKIAQRIREHEKQHGAIAFHTDAGQAPLYLSPHVHTLGVDMLSLGAGKLYGPPGVGVLCVRDPQSIAPMILGGGQEKGLRAGTEKVALAAGCAKALEVLGKERAEEGKRLQTLRDDFAREIVVVIPGAVVNGDLRHALPHMLNISIPGERTGEYLVLQLDHAGIAVSTKSACRSGEASSHVVAALEKASRAVPSEALAKEGRATNTIRFSLGHETTKRELARTLDVLARLFPH